jgi:two-component system, LuxR family, response regulator FixJ
MAREPKVWVVEDDEAVRGLLGQVFQKAGLQTELFASAQEFIQAFDPHSPGCLVTDLELPGMSGLELERWLQARDARLPILFLSGRGTVTTAAAAMRGGALDFLEKPVDTRVLIERVREALERDAAQRRSQEETAPILERLATLTRREAALIDILIAGKSSKQIAFEWGVSQKTVENHRARVMQKMQASNTADLTRMVLEARRATADR